MSINYRRTSECLKQFDFRTLFIEHLGWGNAHGRATTLVADELRYRATPIAELGGMVVFTVEPQSDAPFPETRIQKRIERDLGKIAHEHLIVFLDTNKTKATFLWVKRGIRTNAKDRRHTYERGQPGDALLRKLSGIVFRSEDLDAEGRASIVDVTARIAKAFDVERVTKRFYDDFKKEHDKFLGAIDGIADDDDHAWYTSVMLNRIMFIYFIQYKNLLDNDPQYLLHKLAACKRTGANRFYREFLTTLFFEGFAHEESQRSAETRRLLGRIPYLNGGLFTRHQIEERDGDAIAIPDRAFERLFEFFDGWDWVLEPRPAEYYIEHPDAKEEINPDVLGYIFEKYINQKEMGAYYTKEDITGYICRNTILPFLMDKVGRLRHAAVHPLPIGDVISSEARNLRATDNEMSHSVRHDSAIDPYIYPAVSQKEHLPTETEREYAARRKRLQQIRDDFAAGKIAAINDFITYNLDIEAFVQDFLEGLIDPQTLRAFYFECLKKLTVLDPTVGSGAFLFAAMNILETLYEIALDKMEELADAKYPDFRDELASIAQHPNRAYFIYKTIIVNNLYGVDILEEATEICKLRLFLKLVAQVERDDRKPNLGIEPLPDIDFNIRAGNTLVGYASLEEIEEAGKRSLFAVDLPQKIREADTAIRAYRTLQTQMGISARELAQAKKQTAKKLGEIERALNESLSADYGARSVDKFAKTHEPFHWYVEFNQIMQDGGFDVIVGNPPYVEYKEVQKSYRIRGYTTETCSNLFAFVPERCARLVHNDSRVGMILPLSAFSTDRMIPFIGLVKTRSSQLNIVNFGWRPAKLFDGVNLQLSIMLQIVGNTAAPKIESTRYTLWETQERSILFSKIAFAEVQDGRLSGSIPKLGEVVAASILKKLRTGHTEFGQCLVPKSKNRVYYRRGGLYWKVFVDFETGSSEEKIITLRPEINKYSVIAALSSNLWFWYFTITSDCRHLGNRDINTFPFHPQDLTSHLREKLNRLGQKYVEDLRRNAESKIRVYKSVNKVDVLAFRVKESKPIIDEIDRVLAEHYGFTDAELDFIINYDIKYRMGREAEGEEE
jgi:hypothetical protein